MTRAPRGPRPAAVTRLLGRIHGLDPWLRPLRPARTAARRALLRAYPPPNAARWIGVEAPVVPGVRLRLDPRSYIEWEVLFTGYEPEVRELLRRALRPRDAAIDVGANVGAHTLVMAATGARVVACEPNPSLRARLEINLELNGLDNVAVRPYALAAESGSVILHVPADPVHSGGASLAAGLHEHLEESEEVIVEAVTVDELVAREGIDKLRLLKVDVEGLEAAVLAGAAGVLERDRPDLAFEFTRDWWAATGGSLDQVLDRLRALGYRSRMVTWRGLRPIPPSPPERMNVWATIRG
ncbi:MAG TPA: FkbM family methyltransferase [Candidatus Dormibacteraeota bacterium]